jgi:hypothetical protein
MSNWEYPFAKMQSTKAQLKTSTQEHVMFFSFCQLGVPRAVENFQERSLENIIQFLFSPNKYINYKAVHKVYIL